MYFIPLVFLIYPIGGILYYHYPFWTLFFTLAFVGAYLYSVIIRGESKYHMIAWFTMLTYIFYMTIFINSGFIWYIYFLSNLLVYRFRDKLKSFRFISFACTLATVVFLCFFKASDFGDRIMFLIVPIFCIGYMWIAIENRNSEEQREKIAEQNQYINILSAENERNRIGRDLHDSLGHTFAMMTLKTELALKLLEKRNYDKVQKELSELNHISYQSMSEVRQIVSNLKYRTSDIIRIRLASYDLVTIPSELKERVIKVMTTFAIRSVVVRFIIIILAYFLPEVGIFAYLVIPLFMFWRRSRAGKYYAKKGIEAPSYIKLFIQIGERVPEDFTNSSSGIGGVKRLYKK